MGISEDIKRDEEHIRKKREEQDKKLDQIRQKQKEIDDIRKGL